MYMIWYDENRKISRLISGCAQNLRVHL
jgi:hypothetical protein